MLEHLRDLMAHQSWADAIFFQCWESSQPTLADEDLRKRTAHIAMVQEGFRKLILGEPVSRPPEEPIPTFVELKGKIQASASALRTLLQEMDADRLTRPLQVPWLQGKSTEITIAEALVQVAMHSQHHRGQNMTRFKQLGGTPKNVDWILWVWQGRPEATWD
jgi:uncharacterized damage-inducible protein DinB